MMSARSIVLCSAWFLITGMESTCGSAPNAPADSPIALEVVVQAGLDHPVYLAQPPDTSDRLFVVEQAGRIRIIGNGDLVRRPFLDIVGRVNSTGMEQGLLGLAFHPEYAKNGRYVVNYTRVPDGATVVAEYQASGDPALSRTVEKVLLVIPQPYVNHNGGMVEFGPDGYLYIGMGDGGSRGDPQNRAQNRHELLGKMLRIDVDHRTPYAGPQDNPFAAGGGRPEIFAYGLRNPWRFSFDRDTHELWTADVGQNAWEEIDVVRRGGNYGWRIMEGAHCFAPQTGCLTDGLMGPVAEYRTQTPRCSITGGYVYRGSRLPALQGVYLFGDYCSGEIFGLATGQSTAPVTPQVLLATKLSIASFGEDRAGNLYVVGHQGTIHRITGGSGVTGVTGR